MMLGQWALGEEALGEIDGLPGPPIPEVEAIFTWTRSTYCDSFMWFAPRDEIDEVTALPEPSEPEVIAKFEWFVPGEPT